MNHNRFTVYGIYCLLILLLLIIGRIAHGLAGVSVYESCKSLSCGSTPVDYPLVNEEIIWTQEMENKRIEALKPKKVKVTPKVEKTKEKPKELKHDTKCTSRVRIDLVNHAYKISGGDMKFLGTIASESMFDVGAIGDNGYSIGLCQFHRLYQPDNHREYQKLKTDFHKLEFCHEKYNIWKKRGVLSTRLYGSNVWENGIKKLQIKCS